MITLTEQASNKVKQQLIKRGKGIGLTVGVRTTGCSGLAYVLEYIDHVPVTRDWFMYDSHGVTVWVNGRDSVYLNGLEIDWNVIDVDAEKVLGFNITKKMWLNL